MRLTNISRTIVSLAATSLFSALPLCAQSIGAEDSALSAPAASASTPTTIPTPTKSKKLPGHEMNEPRGKQINAKIANGMLSVDGLVTKVQLNYDITHASKLYFFAPGIGTVILSRTNMPGATLVKDAFSGSEIAFMADGHSYDLSSETPAESGKFAKFEKLAKLQKNEKQDGYIVIDYATTHLDRYPMFGYGNTMTAPYTWPLSKAEPKDNYAHFVAPPPAPANMLPRTKGPVTPSVASVAVGAAPLTNVAEMQ